MSSAQNIASIVEFQTEKEPNCIMKLACKVQPELAKKAHQDAIKEVNKAKAIPGFRKGKAPDATVLLNFPQEVERVFKEKVAQIATNECLKTAPRPLTRDTRILYDVQSVSTTEPSSLTLRYEVEPTLPELDLADFKFENIQKPEVNDEKINETIRQTQYFFATWENVDRPVEKNDCVTLDVDVLSDGKRQSLFKDTRFEVTTKNMAEWMLNAVLGMTVGQEKQVTSIADADATDEEKALFQPKECIIKVASVQKAELPFLDEKFAQNVGASSVDDLREKIKNILTKQSNDHVLVKEREQITSFILEKYPFELPQSQVEQEIRFRLKQLFDDPHFAPYWQSLNEEERRNAIAGLEAQSKKAIRMFYLSQKVIRDKNIKITKEEMNKAPIEPLEVLINPMSGSHNPHGVDLNHAESFSKLVLEKAQDALVHEARNRG
jgi:trigger factor